MLMVAGGIWAYHNSYTGAFVLDDLSSIVENPTIRHLWPLWGTLSPPHDDHGQFTVTGRPVVNLSLALNYSLGGLAVWGYHLFNLTVHILAALTLYGIVRRTLAGERLRPRFGSAAEGLALATALLWTVHPLQTEAVTYIVQRAESLMGLFYLLTLYCFICGTTSSAPKIWFLLAVATCALGMATKEVMVSAPLIVLLYDRTFVTGTFREAWRQRWSLYLGLASTWLLLGYLVASAGVLGHQAGGGKDITWWRYAWTEPSVILHYLQLSLWPHPLCLDYLWPVAKAWSKILPSAIAVAALLGATVWACWRNSAWGFLGAWLFLILAPTSSVLPLPDLAFEHRMYLPLAVLIVAVVIAIFLLGKRWLNAQPELDRALGWGLSGVVACLFVNLTVQRNNDYHSEFSMCQDIVAKRPDNPRAHTNLGFDLQHAGRLPEAIEQYEQALRLDPDYFNAHLDMGSILLELGRPQEAVVQSQEALRLMPLHRGAHFNLGNALLQMGKVTEAITEYEQALRIEPDFAEAHYNLGIALVQLGRPQEAMGHWVQALRIKPDYAEAHYNLGVALVQRGRMPEAIEHLRQALRIKPDFAPAQNALARLQASQ
jgi:tetratricopeptide (TPR) repeat protein